MPKITPYTQTQAFQYQPLGLSAFAAPMAQMQQSLDITKEAIRDTDFDMDTLTEDDTAGKLRIQQYKDTRDELLENLLKTNNYSDAAIKIKKLNKLYNKDPERTVYETNKAKYAEAKEVMKKKLEDQKIEQWQYDNWDYRARVKYAEQGGANFNKATGDYNPIDVAPLGDNLEAEILKITADWGKMSEESIYETFVNKYGIENVDPETIANLKRKYKGSDPELKQQLYNLLSSSDRFQNFWKESAELDYFNTIRKSYGASPATEEGQENLDKFNEEQIQKRRQYYTDLLKDAKDPEQIKAIKKQQQELENNIKNASEMGAINQLAESLYIQDHINERQVGISGGIGDLRSMEEITYDAFGTLDSEGTKKRKEKLKEIQDRKISTKVSGLAEESDRAVPTATGEYATTDIAHNIYLGGSSSQTMEEIEQNRENVLDATNIKNIQSGKSDEEGAQLHDKTWENLSLAEMSPIIKKMEENAPGSAAAYTKEFPLAMAGLVQVIDGFGTLLDNYTTTTQSGLNIEDLEITALQNEYDVTKDEAKRREIAEQITEKRKEAKRKLAASMNAQSDISEFILGAIEQGDATITKLFNDNDKDPVATMRALRQLNLDKLQAFNEKLKDAKTGKNNLGNQNYWYITKDKGGRDQVYFNNIDYTEEDKKSPEAAAALTAFQEAYFYGTPDGALYSGLSGLGFSPKDALLQTTPGSPSRRRGGINMSTAGETKYESSQDWVADNYDPSSAVREIYQDEIENKYKSFNTVGGKLFTDFYQERYVPKATKPTAVILDETTAEYAPSITKVAQGTSEGEGGILGNDPLTATGVQVYVTDPTIGPTPQITKDSLTSNPVLGFDYKAYGKESISYVGDIGEVTWITNLGTGKGTSEKTEAEEGMIYSVNINDASDEAILKRIKERLGQTRSELALGGQNYSYDELADILDGSDQSQRANTAKNHMIQSYKASNPSTVYLGYLDSNLDPSLEAGNSLQEDFTAIDESIAAKRELGKEEVDSYDAAVNTFAHIFLRSDFQNRYMKYLGKAQTFANNLKSDTDYVDEITETANYYQEAEQTLPRDLTLSDGSIIKKGQKFDGLKSYSLTYVLETGRDGQKHMAAKVIELFTPMIDGVIDTKAQFQVGAPQQFQLGPSPSPEELFALEFQFGIGSQNETVYAGAGGKDRVVPTMFR